LDLRFIFKQVSEIKISAFLLCSSGDIIGSMVCFKFLSMQTAMTRNVQPAPANSNHIGRYGQTVIIYNSTTLTEHLLHDGFWGFYKTSSSVTGGKPQGPIKLGAPTSEEYTTSCSATTCQDFEKGTLTWAPNVGVKFYADNQGVMEEVTHHAMAMDQTQVSNPVVHPARAFNPRTAPIYKWGPYDTLAIVSSTNIAYGVTNSSDFLLYVPPRA